jgi:hypothetical protein
MYEKKWYNNIKDPRNVVLMYFPDFGRSWVWPFASFCKELIVADTRICSSILHFCKKIIIIFHIFIALSLDWCQSFKW